MITYNGETKCISEFAEEHNLKSDVVAGRIRMGWGVEKALTTSS